jgi:hypothetical protein
MWRVQGAGFRFRNSLLGDARRLLAIRIRVRTAAIMVEKIC